MYFQSENKKFLLHVYFTQKRVDRREQKHLMPLVTKCVNAFEHFLAERGIFKNPQTIECSLTICGLKKIRSLNKTYRGHSQATDVLSFPLNPQTGLPIIDLGDIYICREKALSQAKAFHIPYHWEVVHLFIHGWLHLLGYDHEISKAKQKEMESLEDHLLEQLTKDESTIQDNFPKLSMNFGCQSC